MSELWIGIGIIGTAILLGTGVLFSHKHWGGTAPPDSLKNMVEIVKICGIFVVAAASFYFIDYHKQREDRDRLDFDIFKAFAEQGTTGDANHKLAVSKTLQNYRTTVPQGTKLYDLLTSLNTTILEDSEVLTLLSLKENEKFVGDMLKDKNQDIANLGQQIQAAPYDALIKQLFSPESILRIRAYDEIRNQFGKNPAVVDELIKYARLNMDNQNGVYNTVVTLKGMDTETTKTKKVEIQSFCREAQHIGEKTRTECAAFNK